MNLLSLPPLPAFLAGVFGMDPIHIVIVVVPIAGIILAGVVTVSALYFQNRRRELWHETARIALEKGQALPPLNPDEEEAAEAVSEKRHPTNHDVRGGMVLIAVGAGLFLTLDGINTNLRFIGTIPGLIGVALLLYALGSRIFTKKS